MNSSEIKRLSLKAFVGFLSFTALVAIVSVLSGEFGEIQIKVLATSLTISAASICAMSCAAFMEKKKSRALGLGGIFLSVASAALVILGLWPEFDSKEYWKTTITLTVFAVAFAHAFLLVLPDLNDRHKWVQRVAATSIGILSLQIVIAVWGEIDEEAYYRVLAMVAIIVGLETLVVPLLMKFQKKVQEPTPQRIVLERIEGELYTDSAGKTFRVTEIGSGSELPPVIQP